MQMYGKFAGLYDPLMMDVDYDGWAGYIAGFLPAGTLRIAECACGTGEITIRLGRLGHNITATDISGDMLQIAAEKARKAALRIPFIQQDMRKLMLHRVQDAVICACDGVNYLAEDGDIDMFLKAANSALKPGGLLLFDVSTRYKLENILGYNTFAEDDGQRAYIWKNCYDPESRLAEMQLSFFYKDGDSYRRFEEQHIQRAYEADELIRAMDMAGFDAAAYGFMTHEPPRADSERIQLYGRKRL